MNSARSFKRELTRYYHQIYKIHRLVSNIYLYRFKQMTQIQNQMFVFFSNFFVRILKQKCKLNVFLLFAEYTIL